MDRREEALNLMEELTDNPIGRGLREKMKQEEPQIRVSNYSGV